MAVSETSPSRSPDLIKLDWVTYCGDSGNSRCVRPLHKKCRILNDILRTFFSKLHTLHANVWYLAFNWGSKCALMQIMLLEVSKRAIHLLRGWLKLWWHIYASFFGMSSRPPEKANCIALVKPNLPIYLPTN